MILLERPEVDILLATYNGEKYLSEQIESIRAQTYSNWRLLISDDCSTDGTLSLLQSYVRADSRVRIVSSGKRFGNAKSNFSNLLKFATSEIVLFSDQDDYWHEDKVEKTVTALMQLEHLYGKQTPLLVSSDLRVTDKNRNVIASSFLDYENFPHDHGPLARVLVQNNAWGCSVGINQALAKIAVEIGDASREIMHDWFLLLLAKSLGHSELIDEPLLDYRQHGDNVAGTHSFSPLRIVAKFNLANSCKYWRSTARQAQVLLDAKNKLPSENCKIISEYIEMYKLSSCRRIVMLVKNQYFPTGATRRLGQLIVYLFGGKKLRL